MTVLALAVLGEVWIVRRLQGEVNAAEREVRERIAEIEQLQRREPAPIEANLRVAREDLANNAEVLKTMLSVLNVSGADDLTFFQGEPATRPDAWFEISQFVDRMTNEAKASGVELKPDERFGFSAYTFEGPEPPYIRSVYRQHRIIEYLLGKLFAAHPRALLGVQREQPAAVQAEGGAPATPATNASARPAARPQVANAVGSASAGEIFVVDPQVSARMPGYVDTMAFRITFSGQTKSLRVFMNALAAPEIPLVVRSVEVSAGGALSGPGQERPAASATRATGRAANPFGAARAGAAEGAEPVQPGAVPIVAENLSVFTVTVEFFEVLIQPPEIPAVPAAPVQS